MDLPKAEESKQLTDNARFENSVLIMDLPDVKELKQLTIIASAKIIINKINEASANGKYNIKIDTEHVTPYHRDALVELGYGVGPWNSVNYIISWD